MALEGSLDTFGLTDVLSLLAMTNKTGDLRLARKDSGAEVTGYVRLRDGVVVAASSDDVKEALARQLVVSGMIPDDAFAEAVASDPAGGSLASALAAAAGISAEDVASLCHEQVSNAVFELLRWPSGAFTFDVVEHAPSPVDASLSVEAAIAEAQTRLAGWPALVARVPAPHTVLATTVTVAGDTALTPAEWGVLGLFDGHRTIGEAITLSTSGEWETVSLLAGLVERRLLVPADDPQSAAHRAGLLSRIGLYAAGAPVPPTNVGPPVVEVSVAEAPVAEAPIAEAPMVAVVPEQAVAHEVAEVDSFETLTTLASAASALEEAPSEAGGDGVDEALLQRLIAGVSAL